MSKILVSDTLSEEGLTILKESGFPVDVKTDLSEEELCKIIGDYECLIIRSGTTVTKKVIDAGKNLRIIGRAGVATLDFMYWVVTSEEGTAMMAEEFGPIPFKNAKATSNVFFNDANNYIANGNYVVTWGFNYTPNVDTWRAGVVAAMTQYSAGAGSWDDVVSAFVQGWATQYAAQ